MLIVNVCAALVWMERVTEVEEEADWRESADPATLMVDVSLYWDDVMSA